MVNEDRVTVRLGQWYPPRRYNQPQLEPDGDIRTKEYDILGEKSVVQKLGENPERFTLRGETYESDIEQLRDMKGMEVSIRHPVHSGKVLIKRVSAETTSSWEEDVNEERWVYEYTIELIGVE